MRRLIIKMVESPVAILFCFVLILLSCKGNQPKVSKAVRTKVTLSDVRNSALSVPIHSNGILVTAEEVRLSFKTGGIVAKLPVEEGRKVKRGELIAALDLSEIKAATDQAELGYEKALRDFERASNLYRDSVATLEQKQDAGTALELAKSRLATARFNLNHSEIVAPAGGIILKRLVKVNEIVGPGYPVIFFGSSDKLWKVKASFSDKDIVKINPGDSAVITFDAWPDVKFPARVEQTGEIANPMTGTYEVELTLEKTGYRLASGFIGAVELYPSSTGTVKLIPVEAVVDADGNEGFVYFLSDDSTVSWIKVGIVSVIGTNLAVSGLPDNVQKVVTGGAAYLDNGEKVDVIRPAEK
jgi:RND family efflux transporter MFP subunit